jgi:transposase-like protein
MTRQGRYSQQVRERAVRMVFEHQGEHRSQWAAICSIAGKFGMTVETLRSWIRQAERDNGLRPPRRLAEVGAPPLQSALSPTELADGASPACSSVVERKETLHYSSSRYDQLERTRGTGRSDIDALECHIRHRAGLLLN